MKLEGPFQFRGEVEWFSADEGGRSTGPPLPEGYAVTGYRKDVGEPGLASFVLRGFDPRVRRSRAEARWLFAPNSGDQALAAGDVVVVTEGLRPVAHFHVDA